MGKIKNIPTGELQTGDIPVSRSHNQEVGMEASLGGASKADLERGYTRMPMDPEGGPYAFNYDPFY